MSKEQHKKDQADKEELALNVNDQQDWNKIQANWAKQQADLARAKAEKFFTADEELPLARHLLLVFIVGFFAVFILWANFATLDEVTRGDGKIIPSSEIQVIQNLEGGILSQVLVKPGDEVATGETLLLQFGQHYCRLSERNRGSPPFEGHHTDDTKYQKSSAHNEYGFVVASDHFGPLLFVLGCPRSLK